MENQKSAFCRLTVYAMVIICFIGGCSTTNNISAPISNVKKHNKIYSYVGNNSVKVVQNSNQYSAIFNGSNKNKKIISMQESIIYNRNYSNNKKGSFFGNIYQVKRGDTLFYIAWITGNDYHYLAQKNNVQKPYILNIGQILQVNNKSASIISNIKEKNILASNNNHYNTNFVIYSVPKSIGCHKNSSKRNILSSSNIRILPDSTNTSFAAINRSVSNAVPVPSNEYGNTMITGWHWPTNGKVIDTFSTTEGGNKGVDISGLQGQPILATASGRVVYAGNALRGYGNLIIIKHNDNYLSAYAHNDKLLVKKEQKVNAGQKIATMGSTGTSTTRLHFEIRYKGKSVNPLYYFSHR